MKVLSGRVLFLLVLIIQFNPLDADVLKLPYEANLAIEKVNNQRNSMWPREGEFLLDTVAGVHSQYNPAVAFDGINYLVVWEDNRGGGDWDIYGARVDQSGTVLDPGGRAIVTGLGDQTCPCVAFDGNNYLVVWESNDYILCKRVNREGEPFGYNLRLSHVDHDARIPSVSYGPTYYLVVWEDFDVWMGIPMHDIYGALVHPTGFAGPPLWLYYYNYNFRPSVSCDGTNYLIAWQHGYSYCDIYGMRLSEFCQILDTIIVSSYLGQQRCPSITFGDTIFLVVWEDGRNGTLNPEIYGARVNQQGVVLDPAGILISLGPADQVSPVAAFDGANYLVVWADGRSLTNYDLYGARMDPFGNVTDEFAVSTQTGDQCSPAIARGQGNQLFITYSGFADSINHIPVNAMRIWGKFYPFTGIEDYSDRIVIRSLLEICPNPFTSGTEIRYSLPTAGCLSEDPTLKIYDCSGRLVRSFDHLCYAVNQESSVIWNGTDDAGRNLPSGVYIVRLQVRDYCATEKLLLVR